MLDEIVSSTYVCNNRSIFPLGLLRTLESMAKPCSVKASGEERRYPIELRSQFVISKWLS